MKVLLKKKKNHPQFYPTVCVCYNKDNAKASILAGCIVQDMFIELSNFKTYL